MNTARNLLLVCFAFGCVPSAGVAETILFESGTLGPTGLAQGTVAATNVTPNVFPGVRFELTQPVITSQVGGHFVSATGGTFFGAIVELDDENDFPDSGDLTSRDVLGTTELAFPTLSDEVFGDLELTLEPGWYVLVFGSGLFDTFGDGAAIRNGVDLGNPSYVALQPRTPFGWVNITELSDIFVNHRFVLKGTVVPEPSTATLLLLGCACVLRRGNGSGLCLCPFRTRWSARTIVFQRLV